MAPGFSLEDANAPRSTSMPQVVYVEKDGPTVGQLTDWLDGIENGGGKIEFGRQRDDHGPFWRLAVNGKVYTDKSLGACLDRAYREAHAP